MTDPSDVRRGYEALAEEYAERRRVHDRELDVFDAFLDEAPVSAHVLDAGCGAGTPVLERLAADAETAVGLDLSRALLDVAADAAPAARLVHGDMTALPFADDAFDAVLAVDAVIHVPLGDHQTVVDEFARVLRPDGRLLLSEAPEEFDRTNSDWLDAGVEMTWAMAGAAATRDHLRAAGFQLTDEWPAPETDPDEPLQPPFFAARLDDGPQSGW